MRAFWNETGGERTPAEDALELIRILARLTERQPERTNRGVAVLLTASATLALLATVVKLLS